MAQVKLGQLSCTQFKYIRMALPNTLHVLAHQGLDLQLTSEELHMLSSLLNMLGKLTLHPTRVFV